MPNKTLMHGPRAHRFPPAGAFLSLSRRFPRVIVGLGAFRETPRTMAVDAVPSRGRVARALERMRRPNRDHVEALKRRVPFWFVFVLLFAFASWQILTNPFGFSDSV